MDIQEYLTNDYKIYIEVNADFSENGEITPRAFTWEDGTRYEVDRILSVCRAASLKAGGCGIRYTVRAAGKSTFMFLEEDDGVFRWFMERRKAKN